MQQKNSFNMSSFDNQIIFLIVEKVIIRKQERLINGDSISWSPSIISPEQFMNKFDIN